MRLKFDGLWIALVSMITLLVVGCGAGTGTDDESSAAPRRSSASTGGTVTVPTVPEPNPVTDPAPIATATPLPLPEPHSFTISGVGNHPRHICVPRVVKSLNLRIKPVANFTALAPHYPSGSWPAAPKFSDGSFVYDGTAAYYTKLQVRLSIPGTNGAFNLKAGLEQYSPATNLSPYLKPAPGVTLPQETALKLPEYTDIWIWGSSPWDGQCTYWEKYFGKCSQISNSFRTSEAVSCEAGEQKVMITHIASDYPCNDEWVLSAGAKSFNDKWCVGSTLQYVTDYQPWNVVIEAATDETEQF